MGQGKPYSHIKDRVKKRESRGSGARDGQALRHARGNQLPGAEINLLVIN
jgi:hypothetical protein